jgi:drug/metabolite transporter superfamily protein YnfA
VYKFLLYLHVAGALAFLLFHGATASVMFALKREHEPQRVQALLELRDRSSSWWGYPVVVMLLSGIIMGFMGRHWSAGWMWASLGGFVVLSFAMSGFGRNYLDRAWHALDPEGHKPPMKKYDRGGIPASPEELAEYLATGRPMMLTVLGVLGLGLILWLMMFQPF